MRWLQHDLAGKTAGNHCRYLRLVFELFHSEAVQLNALYVRDEYFLIFLPLGKHSLPPVLIVYVASDCLGGVLSVQHALLGKAEPLELAPSLQRHLHVPLPLHAPLGDPQHHHFKTLTPPHRHRTMIHHHQHVFIRLHRHHSPIEAHTVHLIPTVVQNLYLLLRSSSNPVRPYRYSLDVLPA